MAAKYGTTDPRVDNLLDYTNRLLEHVSALNHKLAALHQVADEARSPEAFHRQALAILDNRRTTP